MAKKILVNILIAIIVVAISIAGTFLYVTKVRALKGILSPEKAAQKAVDYINKNKDTLTQGAVVSLVSVSDTGQIYKVRLKIGDQEFDSYVSKDGNLLFPGAYDLTQEAAGESSIPKSDKPDVKLFVMSYCPYGLQAQKMFLSVYNLFKDKADMGVYFVDYIMHEKKEIDENLRQYCIQKEEIGKYYDYLNCFVKAGDFESCLLTANIDKTKLNSCITSTDNQYNVYSQYNDKSTWLNGQYPKFDVQADLNTQYGVQGSPTIIINGQTVDVNPRSPEQFKETICSAFNTPPEECSQTLSERCFFSRLGFAKRLFQLRAMPIIMPKVRWVFSTPACPYCFTLKEFLKGRNIEFEDIDVSKDEKEREEMVKKTGKLEVPVVEVGDKFVVSFDKKKICQLLGIEE